MINSEIVKQLHEETKLSSAAIYFKIDKKRKEIGYAFSRETAAYVLASEHGIEITKFLNPEELSDVREAIRSSRTPQTVGGVVTHPKERIVSIKIDEESQLNCPNVPESVLKDANKMSKVYPYIYVFENSIRYFITETLERKYGKDWWPLRVNSKIRDKAEDRQSKEGRNRWHGKRGAHPIFYIDIDQLLKIITSNFSDFQDAMPGVDRPIEWLTNRIEEIELSRNIVAHNNPLSDDDIERLKMYFKDWSKQFASFKTVAPQ
jgi:hypothetical protein